MSDLITPAVDEIMGIVKTTLNLSAANPQYRSGIGSRIDWRKLIQNVQSGDAAGLTLPYTVMDIGNTSQDDGWSGVYGKAYRLPITIYLIDDLNNAVLEEMEISMQTLRDKFLRKLAFTNFQLTDDAELDSSPHNAANYVFLESNYQLFAVAMHLNPLIGELYPGLAYG